jgi:hypothetical protein
MANLGPMGPGRVPAVPTLPKGESIGRYQSYLDAQRAVDFLSDEKFPVQAVTIVGTGLRMVERVTGRLTYPRVALAGALSGAWFGTFVGLLLLLFAPPGEGVPLLAAILLGAGFGMLFGLISYSFTRGRRDFTSTSQIVASEYEILCAPEHAQTAREVLWRLPGGRGSGDPAPSAAQPPAGAWPPPSGPGWQPGPQQGQPWGPPPGQPGQPGQPGGYGQPQQQPNGTPAEPAPQAEVTPEPDLSGPTYGEMMARRRREEAERREREAREGSAQDG